MPLPVRIEYGEAVLAELLGERGFLYDKRVGILPGRHAGVNLVELKLSGRWSVSVLYTQPCYNVILVLLLEE